MRSLALLFFLFVQLFASESSYTLGHGLKLHEMLSVGSYLSTEYINGKNEDVFKVDDIAVLAYGELFPTLSYLAELEALNFYSRDFANKSEEQHHKFHIERFYADYRYSDSFGVRIGKMITPIGYWNLEPINVLRDTTSNPYYAKQMFPRFVSGIDLNGYVPKTEATKYHLFAQKNRDFDEAYINIPNEHFFGLSIEHEVSMELSLGGSIGEFISLNEDRFDYLQLNAKYEDYPYAVSAEAMVRYGDYDNAGSEYSTALYTQGLYRFSTQHCVVGRYEYYNDDATEQDDHAAIIGYSYRPVYPVSLKAEYQLHSQSELNRFLASFSVLF